MTRLWLLVLGSGGWGPSQRQILYPEGFWMNRRGQDQMRDVPPAESWWGEVQSIWKNLGPPSSEKAREEGHSRQGHIKEPAEGRWEPFGV